MSHHWLVWFIFYFLVVTVCTFSAQTFLCLREKLQHQVFGVCYFSDGWWINRLLTSAGLFKTQLKNNQWMKWADCINYHPSKLSKPQNTSAFMYKHYRTKTAISAFKPQVVFFLIQDYFITFILKRVSLWADFYLFSRNIFPWNSLIITFSLKDVICGVYANNILLYHGSAARAQD